jgi:hypothetical protein
MAWRVFYSYSHKDGELRGRLATYLGPLTRQGKIVSWHDRDIRPGADWNAEISDQLETADLILFLVSEHFLDSDYCFGVEVEAALSRLKRGDVSVVPVLLKPCLWQESRFSQLQFVPRDAKPIMSSRSPDDAFAEVAREIGEIVSQLPPARVVATTDAVTPMSGRSIDLVRRQIASYAQLYERTRQRMQPSSERTHRMEQIFEKMRAAALASYPLLDELSASPSPGERLAAVAILEVFASEEYLPYLVTLIGSEKPFVGYHAAKAIQFAVGAFDAKAYDKLMGAIQQGTNALQTAHVGFDTNRQRTLRAAEEELRGHMAALAAPPSNYD